MEVATFRLGELATNCYLLVCPHTRKCLLIDPGGEGGFLAETLLRRRLTPVAFVATHGHFDHLLAVGELQRSFPAPLLLHPADWFLLSRLSSSARYWLSTPPPILPPTEVQPLEEGGVIRFGRCRLEVLHTPGHTPGSVSLVDPKEKRVFCGDLIFAQGVGRTDFAYSDWGALQASLKKLFRHATGFVALPGHGPSFVLAKKQSSPPFLSGRCEPAR